MSAVPPPQVFSPARRMAVRRRFRSAPRTAGSAQYLIDDMVEDVTERLAFVRVQPRRALVIGDWTHALGDRLAAQGAEVLRAEPYGAYDEFEIDQEQPFPFSGFDFIASLSALDTANDLVGALIHIRQALAPGGLAIASFAGAGSLPALRAAMLAADGDRPAPRLHPMVDVRTGAQLLQRAGWADPVVDSRHVDVRFSALPSLVADLRAQGLSNCLARPGPPLTRGRLRLAAEAFGTRTTERFEILTLSGWKR